MKIPKNSIGTNIFITVILSLIQLPIIHFATIVYVPLFFMLVFAFFYGILEPKWGWVLSFLQVIILISGYWVINKMGFEAANKDYAIFATHVSIFPSFVAAFFGSFIYRL
jgi:hypothetical protein